MKLRKNSAAFSRLQQQLESSQLFPTVDSANLTADLIERVKGV